MIDVSQYKKIAEFRDGSLHWLSDDIKNIVYIMVFGEDYYIGSTREIRRRFSQYVPALKRGKYDAKRLQAAFNREGGFDVYQIEGGVPLRTLREREDYYLNKLKPTLNARLYADALLSDLFPKPTKREHVNLKGVQTYIPIPDYLRLCRLKTLRRETISDMFYQAIIYYLDKCEGKI